MNNIPFKFLSVLVLAAIAIHTVHGQTPAPAPVPVAQTPNLLPPLPPVQVLLPNFPTVGIANETVGLSIGPAMEGASTFANANLIDWSVSSMFFLRGEIDVDVGTASVVDAAGLGGGIYKSFPTARLYAVVEGRRNWSAGRWEGILGAGGAWTPMASSSNIILQNSSVGIEPRLVLTGIKGKPPVETIAYVRYSFGSAPKSTTN